MDTVAWGAAAVTAAAVAGVLRGLDVRLADGTRAWVRTHLESRNLR